MLTIVGRNHEEDVNVYFSDGHIMPPMIDNDEMYSPYAREDVREYLNKNPLVRVVSHAELLVIMGFQAARDSQI